MEEKKLYHISCLEYAKGYLVPLPEVTFYHQYVTEKGLGWIDDYLNSLKPANYPSRSRTFYAFGNIQHCLSFFSRRICETGNKRLYKVQMENPITAPMCLTDGLKNNGEGNDNNEAIANEYWHPIRKWKVLEYLSERMQILEDITSTVIGLPQFGNFDYGEDQKLRKELFNC